MLALFTDAAAKCAVIAQSTAGREQILRDLYAVEVGTLSRQEAQTRIGNTRALSRWP